MILLEEFKKCKGRNQARMILKAHCETLGIHYKEYVMTTEENRSYFSKGPYSPYTSFSHKSAIKP